jgi:hypothetical protein
VLVENHKDDAMWELMYFGHARDQQSPHSSRARVK